MCSCTFIKKHILTLTRSDMQFFLTYHIMKNIRIDTGSIDDTACLKITLWGFHNKTIFLFSDVLYFCVKFKFHAIVICVLCHCNVQLKGTDNSGCRCIQCCQHLIRQIRLHGKCLFSVKDPQSLYSVFQSSFTQLMQHGNSILSCTDSQRTSLFKRKIQFLRKLSHHIAALHIQFRHKASRFCIITGMSDSAVCLGSSTAYILFSLQNADFQPISWKLSRRCRSGNSCSDNDHIIHRSVSPFLFADLLNCPRLSLRRKQQNIRCNTSIAVRR